jgi:GTPase SAR1 family protein
MNLKRKDDYIPSYKILVVGTRGVGKSEIIRQYVNFTFSPKYSPTENFISYNKIVNLNQGKDLPPVFVRINIIDT